jgi:hypothetical protein
MPRPKNAMEIFTLLDKSNCRECGEKTCLAFAGAVYQGRKKIQDCPKLDRAIIDRFSDSPKDQNSQERNRDEYLEFLQNEIRNMDLAGAAERVGADFSGGKLTLKVLGKDFSVDTTGKLSADIHINPWVAAPFLDYIRYGKGLPVAGNWLSFRELKDGKARYPLRKAGAKTVRIRHIRGPASPAAGSHHDMLLAAGRRPGIQPQSIFR